MSSILASDFANPIVEDKVSAAITNATFFIIPPFGLKRTPSFAVSKGESIKNSYKNH
jgi:hypothetical protein